jgi:chromate transport protein ChrA
MLYGMGGAVLAVLAILLPVYLMVPLLRGYEHLQHSASVRRVTRGLTSASVGLIFAATLDLARSSLRAAVSATVCAVALLALLALLLRPKWNPILVLLASSGVGLLLATALWGR